MQIARIVKSYVTAFENKGAPIEEFGAPNEWLSVDFSMLHQQAIDDAEDAGVKFVYTPIAAHPEASSGAASSSLAPAVVQEEVVPLEMPEDLVDEAPKKPQLEDTNQANINALFAGKKHVMPKAQPKAQPKAKAQAQSKRAELDARSQLRSIPGAQASV